MVEGTLNAPRRNTFRARQSVSRVQWNEGQGETKNKFTYLQDLHISAMFDETFLEGCLRSPGTCHHVQN